MFLGLDLIHLGAQPVEQIALLVDGPLARPRVGLGPLQLGVELLELGFQRGQTLTGGGEILLALSDLALERRDLLVKRVKL